MLKIVTDEPELPAGVRRSADVAAAETQADASAHADRTELTLARFRHDPRLAPPAGWQVSASLEAVERYAALQRWLSAATLRRVPSPKPAVAGVPVSELPALCSAAEAAAALRVSVRTLKRYVAAGAIKAIQHRQAGSSRMLISRSELTRYLTSL